MAPLQLAHETLLRRHQLRGSVLPILTMAYNASRQHLLTADEQALRLFSTRKELSVLWLDPESPSPMILLHHAIHDVYIVVYDDQPADHPDACAVQILHASLAPLLRWRPHDGAVAAAVLHPSSGVLVTSGSDEDSAPLTRERRGRSSSLRGACRSRTGCRAPRACRGPSARRLRPGEARGPRALPTKGVGSRLVSRRELREKALPSLDAALARERTNARTLEIPAASRHGGASDLA